MSAVGPAALDRIFTALADPGRRAFVERLAAGPASVKELAAPTGIRLPSALQHPRVLEEGGIVVSAKSGRTRTYAISPTAFGPVSDWIAARRAVMNAAFDRLEAALAEFPEEKDE